MKQVEILAPAGSLETLRAAYKAGADAVYIGGTQFGARAYADNADRQELLRAIDYAHLHGRRLYLTVNTLLKNTELERMLLDYLRPFYEQGLDAVIVQDLGVLDCIHDNFPDLPIHASTQMTICGAEYGAWLGRQGVTRIVTPRELSLSEIKAMKQGTNLEIETFVHGALCYCYSGQCLMSSMIGGRSGNRGRCAQPCRLPYAFDGEEGERAGYLLSPKDLCGLDILPALLEAGADSLKIEGRMKKPEYAALTASLYRHYTDMYLEYGASGYRVEQEDKERLMDLYNRGGFTDGYFKRHNGKEMMSLQRPNHSGLRIGTVEMGRKNEVTIRTQKSLSEGDMLELPDGTAVKTDRAVAAGGTFRVKYTGKKIKGSKPVIRTRNEYLIREITDNFVKDYELKEKIYGSVNILKDFPAKIEVYNGLAHVILEGEIVQKARNHPLTAAEVSRRIRKTGGTPFEFAELNVTIDDDCYMSIQGLNELRRGVLEKMEAACLAVYRRQMPEASCDIAGASNISLSGMYDGNAAVMSKIHVLVSDMAQLEAVLQFEEVSRIYMNDEGDDALLTRAARTVHAANRSFYLAAPYIMRLDTAEAYRRREFLTDTSFIDGFLVRNMETVLLLRDMGVMQPCIADYNLYGMNNRARQRLLQQVDELTLPVELNRRELEGLSDRSCSELIVYGYLPLMVSAQCLLKTTGKCTKTPSVHYLTDRRHKRLAVRNVCRFCYNLIYNSVPLHLIDAITQDGVEPGAASVRLQFLEESGEQAASITDAYIRAFAGSRVKSAEIRDYTKGHYQRGIE